MSMRAKFRLNAVIGHEYGPGVKAFFRTEYDPSLPEDVSFSKATPNGQIEILVDNPEAIKQLVIGKTYYVEFIPGE